MKKLIILILLITSVAAFSTTKKHVLNIQHWQTKNGVKVYFVRAPQLPMLDLRVVFKAGSAYDGQKLGLANLVNAMFGEGSTTKTADEIASDFDNVGAQFSNASSRDMVQLSLRTLIDPKYFNSAIATFSDVLTHPNFPEKALQRIKNQAVASIKISQQNPYKLAQKTFNAAIYKGTSYAHPVIGTLKSLPTITQQDCQDFYHRFYVAKNADVIMVGDLTRQQAEKIAQQVVGSLAQGKAAPTLKKAPNLTKGEMIKIKFPAKQTTIIMGQVGITRKNPNYYPLIMGNAILGGLSSTSILFDQVRDKHGLAYFAMSGFNVKPYRGPFVISLQTKSTQANEALNVVKTVLQDYLTKGPTKQQLDDAKLNVIGGFPLNISTNKKILGVVTNIVFYNRPLDYLDYYRESIKKVTAAQINSAFRREIKPDKMVIVMVGP